MAPIPSRIARACVYGRRPRTAARDHANEGRYGRIVGGARRDEGAWPHLIISGRARDAAVFASGAAAAVLVLVAAASFLAPSNPAALFGPLPAPGPTTRTRTFYDDPDLSYSVVHGNRLTGWDAKRSAWLRSRGLDPSSALVTTRVVMVSGSQPEPCAGKDGDYLLARVLGRRRGPVPRRRNGTNAVERDKAAATSPSGAARGKGGSTVAYAAARNAAVRRAVPGPDGGGVSGWRRPFVTHFTGCAPCSGQRNPIYSRESCDGGIRAALDFADDQVLRAYGFRHVAPGNDSVTPLPFDYPAAAPHERGNR
ncbi:hypothetical protein PR202_ga22236 [Eleusine coracana subsp. coracana]|uniref:Uncharacterized protein n=1 Tax=Eleusine coracana subsp. coracana TaxID=191504 RepID=A0AAV5D319_ELECO|nr:hypothetical protein PR202_ga22236 [Eleusine coracana subsp. coracana]